MDRRSRSYKHNSNERSGGEAFAEESKVDDLSESLLHKSEIDLEDVPSAGLLESQSTRTKIPVSKKETQIVLTRGIESQKVYNRKIAVFIASVFLVMGAWIVYMVLYGF